MTHVEARNQIIQYRQKQIQLETEIKELSKELQKSKAVLSDAIAEISRLSNSCSIVDGRDFELAYTGFQGQRWTDT